VRSALHHCSHLARLRDVIRHKRISLLAVHDSKVVIDAACDWIAGQIDNHTDAIRDDLQGRTYSALAAMPRPPKVDLPTSGSI
jgi:hypothetical protein